MPPLQPQHTPRSTPITRAIEQVLWARLELLGAFGDRDISYCRQVLDRRMAEYRRLMQHPVGGLRHNGNGEYK